MFIVINKYEFLLHIFLTSLSAKWVFLLKHPFMNASFLSEFEIVADTKLTMLIIRLRPTDKLCSY